MKTCRKCAIPKAETEFNRDAKSPDGRRATCRSCTRSAMAQWHADNPNAQREWLAANRERQADHNRTERRRHREKWLARKSLQQAVERGTVVKPKVCSSCGSPGRIEGHHDDYSRRFDVRWLCVPCHRQVHAAALQGADR